MGDEQDGKGSEYVRPVLIMKKFNKNLFWGCPLSEKIKLQNRYYVSIDLPVGTRSVIIS